MSLHSHHRPSPITRLPNELIDEIAFNIACDGISGLSTSLTPFMLTCKRNYEVIMGESGGKAVWRRIFKHKFSWSARERRGRRVSAEGQGIIGNDDYLFQLRLYTRTLKDVGSRVAMLRREEATEGDLNSKDNSSGDDALFEPEPICDDSQTIEELMWVLWVMCLEDDGCNRIQMDSIGVYDWVEAFIQRRLYDGAIEGWPCDNAVNSCALHVFWFLTTKGACNSNQFTVTLFTLSSSIRATFRRIRAVSRRDCANSPAICHHSIPLCFGLCPAQSF